MNHFVRYVALASLAASTLSGCMGWWPEVGLPAKGNETYAELNPMQEIVYSMHDAPAMEDQEKGMRYLPPGTVADKHLPFPFRADEQAKANELVNPVKPTAANLAYGKMQYETTCIVCHGARGKGAGYVVPPYPQPPDLTSARARNFSDGHFYHVIVHGQGRMWSYKNQLDEMERWAVVNYIRALQRAENPEPADLERVTD